MKWFKDINDRRIRLIYERQDHIEVDHPEMIGRFYKLQDALSNTDIVVGSRTDSNV